MPNHHDLMMYEAFAVLGGAVVMFAWGRFRYDLIAVCALLVGVLIGIVPAKNAFSGFTSDVVVIIACSLVISAAVARSGLAERLLKPILPRLKTANTQVPALAGATALLSMPTKNVGALAILMPVALRVARQTGTSPSSLLMPMSFVSLLGGLVTLVGTSTNIIVSQVREQTLGKPFQMFDFAYVGLPLTLFGLAFVSVAWRLLPTGRQGQSSMGEAMNTAPFSTEALVKDGLPEGGLTSS
jgi:di/tricarboxylate transporter